MRATKRERSREEQQGESSCLHFAAVSTLDRLAKSNRKHLLIAPLEGGSAKDLTPGAVDSPTFSLGGPDDFVISPDGKELAYVTNTERDQSTSTNTDIFVVPMSVKASRSG